MTEEIKKPRPPKIYVSEIGSIKVDEDEFFSHPNVLRQIEEMQKMKIQNGKLVFEDDTPTESSA